MKKITLTLTIVGIALMSLCGCARVEEVTLTTESNSEATTTVSSEEVTSVSTSTNVTNFGTTNSETVLSTDYMDTSFDDSSKFPTNSVFLDEISNDLQSQETFSYLEQMSHLPKAITDFLEKGEDCYLYNSRSSDLYEKKYAIYFYRYGINNAYCAEFGPVSSECNVQEYKLEHVSLYFDKNFGNISLYGYLDRSLCKCTLDYLSFGTNWENIQNNIIISNVDTMDSNNIIVFHTYNSPYDQTLCYDKSAKELALYQLGNKLKYVDLELDDCNLNFSFNHQYLTADNKLVFWEDRLFPYLEYEIISDNVKQKIDNFYRNDNVYSDFYYTLYEKLDGKFLLTRSSIYDDYPCSSLHDELSSLEESMTFEFRVDNDGRCYLYKHLYIDDMHLKSVTGKHICYLPEENRDIDLLNTEFRYSDKNVEEKTEELMIYLEDE